jgi:hypothetical protein
MDPDLDAVPSRGRRGLVAAGAVALVLAGGLVARATHDPPPPPPVATPDRSTVVSVAIGTQWAYALVADCDTRIVHQCDYQVHRRELSGAPLGTDAWSPLPIRISGRTTTGLAVTLSVVPGDRLVVVDRGRRVYASVNGGTVVTTAALRPGPPVAAVPDGGLLATGLCPACSETVVALDPGTGLLSPLAHQPPLPAGGTRLARADGTTLWVVRTGPGTPASAVSQDGGLSWRRVPLAGPLGARPLLTAAPGGGAYLVGAGGVWQAGRIGGWRRIRATGPDDAYSAAAATRGLIVGDAAGRAWRLQPTGTYTRLPERPGFVTGAVGGVVAGLPDTPGTVLLSYDSGDSWQAERVG